jgi:putative heme-binding domain-containing protein
LRGPTPEEKLAEVRRLNNDLRAGTGDADRGRQLFREKCASCHVLFGEGKAVGPDLTYANRGDRDFLLVSLVDPSGTIRKEYQPINIALQDGRVVNGMVAAETPEGLTLVDSQLRQTLVPRSEIESVEESPVSIMPEGLYREFSPEQLRDLFQYIQGGGK